MARHEVPRKPIVGASHVKVLVYPNSMAIGGSQLTAIEIARGVADLGHDVTVFGPPGPLSAVIADMHIPFLEAPPRARRPSRAVMRALTEAVRAHHFDIVHAYEWPPSMEAAYGPHLRCSTPIVSTVMSMAVAPFLPRHVPLIVGTQLIQESSVAAGRTNVHLIEPPVDTVANQPREKSAEFARTWRLEPDVPVVVLVSRLAKQLKQDGLLEAMDAMASVNLLTPARLLIVGDGPSRSMVEARASAVNAAARREVVTVTGPFIDPRPAYAAADVLLGMGSSVLRGMAFGKPAIVQGEAGFWKLLTPQSLPIFMHQGWYGIGVGDPGAPLLAGIISALLADATQRKELGAFSRQVVEDRFSVTRAAALQVQIYRDVFEAQPARRSVSLLRASAGLAAYKVQRKADRLRGRAADADFNAREKQPLKAGGRVS